MRVRGVEVYRLELVAWCSCFPLGQPGGYQAVVCNDPKDWLGLLPSDAHTDFFMAREIVQWAECLLCIEECRKPRLDV